MFFRDKYWFLSNMFPCRIFFDGLTFISSENLYQALKTEDLTVRERFCYLSPHEAKKQGKKIKLRVGFEDLKLQLMYIAVSEKFIQNPELKCNLLKIKCDIIEDNNWGDVFWGVCNGVGENNLGKILMRVRDE